MNAVEHPRYGQALWYAWGQQDAGIGTGVNVFGFALDHAKHAVRLDNGKTTHLPSVQDAWSIYVSASAARSRS